MARGPRRHRGSVSALLALSLLVVLGGDVRASDRTLAASPAPLDATTLARIDSLRIAYEAEAALSEIGPLIPRARAAGDSSFLAEMLLRQGELETSLGRPARGEPPLREAISIAEAREDSLLLGASLRWLAVAVGNQGEVEAAAALYRRLLALATAAGDRRHEGWARVGLAWHASFRGRDEEAAREYRRAVTCLEETEDPRGEAWARNGLGVAFERLGKYDAARGSYEAVLELGVKLAHPPLESMACNNLGSLALALGDPGVALGHFQRALELQQRIGNQRGAFDPALNVAICQSRLGRTRDAELSLQELREDCRKLGYRQLQGTVLNQQAAISLQEGRYRRAAKRSRQTLSLGDAVPLRARADAHVGLARALAAMDSAGAALAVLEHSEREIRGSGLSGRELALLREQGRLLQSTGRHEEALDHLLRADRAAAALGVAGFRVETLARAARSVGALGRPDSALVLLRRAGNIWEAERSQPLDPEWREQRGVAGRLVYTALAARILESPELGEAARTREAFDQLQVFKARTLLERMLGPYGGREPSARTLDPITLPALQSKVLRERELFLDAFLGPETSFLFAVTRDECRAVPLPSEDDLTELLVRYRGFLAHPPDETDRIGDDEILRSAGRRLDHLLFSGVRDLLQGCDVVVFSPDGSLNLLSPSALAAGAPRDVGAGPVWSRVPSATVLWHLRRGESNENDAGSLRILALAGRETPSGARLHGAVREVRQLGRRFRGVEVLVLGGATAPGDPPVGVETLAPYELLHLAAHAGLDDQYPWRSAIRLGPGEERGRLLAADVAAASLEARLVVLAACDSGAGRVLSGEGVLGLSSAFLSAGAPAVIGSLWPADDGATERLMRTFYAELARGRSAASALHRAQATLRGDPATGHPFYWAGFVLIGDGEIRVPLRRRLTVPWIPGLALVVVVGLILLPRTTRPGRRSP